MVPPPQALDIILSGNADLDGLLSGRVQIRAADAGGGWNVSRVVVVGLGECVLSFVDALGSGPVVVVVIDVLVFFQGNGTFRLVFFLRCVCDV